MYEPIGTEYCNDHSNQTFRKDKKRRAEQIISESEKKVLPSTLDCQT